MLRTFGERPTGLSTSSYPLRTSGSPFLRISLPQDPLPRQFGLCGILIKMNIYMDDSPAILQCSLVTARQQGAASSTQVISGPRRNVLALRWHTCHRTCTCIYTHAMHACTYTYINTGVPNIVLFLARLIHYIVHDTYWCTYAMSEFRI